MALDRLGVQPLLADPRDEHRHWHLSPAEARDLDAGREVGGSVLDGVVDVCARHVHREPDLVVRELLDLHRHAAIRPEGYQAGAGSRLRALCRFTGCFATGSLPLTSRTVSTGIPP